MKMTTTQTFPVTINDDADYRQAQKHLFEAQRQLDEVQRTWTKAETELHDAEHDAATGTRNQRRLQAARDNLTQHASEYRIATARVAAAEKNATKVRNARLTTLEREMREARDAEIRAMKDALDIAMRHSHNATAIEQTSGQLFSGGPYRQRDGLPGQPLQPISWTREFGGPHGVFADTRYGLWLRFCGLFNE
jgi:hypothetical protein